MRFFPRAKIFQWYQEDYNRDELESVYHEAPTALQRFYRLIGAQKDTVKKVSDLGCGDGRSLIELAKRGFEVIGIDIAGKEAAEKRAKRVGVRIRFLKEDITVFRFERERYDAIICSEVFHLMSRDEVELVLDRIIEATHERGYVYISILSDLKRNFLKTGEEFGWESQAEYSVAESKELLSRKFNEWDIVEMNTFHDEQDWPLKLGNYPIGPYHWSGEYVYLIVQKI